MKIDRKTLLSEVVKKSEKATEMLVMKYGFHCIGCYGAQMETLEEGARVHGMKEKEIDKLVEKLNLAGKGKSKK